MKLISVTTQNQHGWSPTSCTQFLCLGNNCYLCEFRFKCKTSRDYEMLTIELDARGMGLTPASAYLNKKTHSKVYREGTKKYKKYKPYTLGAIAW